MCFVECAALLCLAAPLAAVEPPMIVKELRADPVILFDAPDVNNKVGQFSRSEFSKPWPVLSESSSKSLQVQTEKGTYWVKPYQVVTDRRYTVSATCGTVLASKASGATRGVGEECKK